MKRVLYIISDIDRAKAFEWIADHFHRHSSIDIWFCFLTAHTSATVQYLAARNAQISCIHVRGKRDWPFAFVRLLKLLRRIKPDVVHCHLLTASVLGLSAAYVSHVKSRIFTRHHGSMHHTIHRKGLIWDFLCNNLATKIVSISPATSTILLDWERVRKDKVVFIPHGFPREPCGQLKETNADVFRWRYNISKCKKVIGVVSRFEDWKGIQYTLKAFKGLLENRTDCHLLLMNAVGSYSQAIDDLLTGFSPSDYTIVVHDPDMSSAYAAMDVFVHVPVDPYVEAFGQVYIEAMTAGVPMICTLSGIAPTIVKPGVNALVVPFQNSAAIRVALLELIANPVHAESLAARAQSSIGIDFSLDFMCEQLGKLYTDNTIA